MVKGVLNVIAPLEGQTRICLDPWAKVFVRASGQVCLCCNAGPIGSLNDNSLDDILNNDKAVGEWVLIFRVSCLDNDKPLAVRVDIIVTTK